MGTLTFEPLLPLALWLALALAGAAAFCWYVWRRPAAVPRGRWFVIGTLMAVGFALVLALLLNPTWVEPIAPPAGKPLLTVLVDSTASMATADVGPQTRYRAAAELARACRAELSDEFDVRVATFDDTVRVIEPSDLEGQSPEGQTTDLAAAITGGMEENRPQGQALLLLSDGIDNAGGGAARLVDAVRLARARNCRIYTRTFGGDAQVKDLAVDLRTPQELAFVGQKVPITVSIRQRGLAGSRTALILRHDRKELERKPLDFLAGSDREITFDVSQDRSGLYRYEIEAEPVAGEVNKANNQATLLLRVVNEPVRLLLLEGKPYWDSKFLMRTLISDRAVEVDAIVRMGEGRYHLRTLRRNGEGAAPQDKRATFQEEWKSLTSFSQFLTEGEKLRGYQVVVLGRDAESFLSDATLAQLRTWLLRDGGSLVCYRGQPTAQVNQRLAQLLPLQWSPGRESRFRLSLTERGRDLHLFAAGPRPDAGTMSRLPTLATTAWPQQPKPLAVVLATAAATGAGTDAPGVTYQPYGTGRVVVIEGSGMWRWAFLPAEQQQGSDVYRDLWHGLLRWLASSADLLPGQKLALRTDKVVFNTREPATATLVLREEASGTRVPPIELTGAGLDKPQEVTAAPLGDEPGTFRLVFGKLPEGHYQARVQGGDATATTAFDVRSPSDEQLDLKARPELMARIATESGGKVLEGDSPSAILGQFREHVHETRPQRVRRLPAWDRWWVLLGVFAVWSTAWGLRRASGLV
jgi:hypothetical protein